MPDRRELTVDEASDILERLQAGEALPDGLTPDDVAELMKFAASSGSLRAAVAERFALEFREQEKSRLRKATRRSAELRRQRNIPRDRRVHDARANGTLLKVIANDERISMSTVSDILAKPRP